jgi:magnesium and cobalt exporter, CNNM family
MSSADIWSLVAAAGLVLLAGLLAAAETAVSRVSRSRVEELEDDARRGARQLAAIVADPANGVNSVLLARTLCEISAVVLVAATFLDQWPGWTGGLLAVGVMVVVSYVVVGVAPRTLGRQHAERYALVVAPGVRALGRLLSPLTRLLIGIGNALTPGRGFRDGPFTSEAELRDLVDFAEESKLIEHDEREMIHSVFELGDTVAREVMVPRTEMVVIEKDKSLRQAMSLALRSGFSRIPVIGENMDDVLGVVYLKDITKRVFDNRDANSSERVASVMRSPFFVPDSKPADELLRAMQAERTHVAIVVDEYGGTGGLVTIEDVLEEIVGEITDEYDTEEPEVQELGNGDVRLSARYSIDDLVERFDLELEDEEEDDVDSVGGLLANRLGKVPIAGSSVVVDGWRLTAESTGGRRNRIATVLMQRVEPASAGSQGQERAGA